MPNFTNRKPWSIMTFTVLILFCDLFPLPGQDFLTSYAFNNSRTSSAIRHQSSHQLKGIITLQADSLTLAEVLSLVELQTKYVFIYTDDEIPIGKKFSFRVENKSLQAFLDEFLSPLKIKHRSYGKQIVLSSETKKSRKQKTSFQPESLPAETGVHRPPDITGEAMNTINFPAVEFSVQGIVLDESNNPLPGVNVLEKGTSNGTVTDVKGTYKINVTDENATLVFSFIGYLAKEVSVNRQSSIDVTLVPDIQTLSEVVVIGYGEQKKSDLTGSVATVKAEDVKNMPVPTLAEAVQSRIAGVVVNQGSGEPGRTARMLIRGTGTLKGLDPLWIVDGVQLSNPEAQFNFNDIETIQILKDASAAAIYGARAAGGVVIVTTKKGKKGKPQVTFNSVAGVTQIYNMPTLLNRDQYIQAKKAYNPGIALYDLTPDQLAQYPDTDWVDVLYDNGYRQNYNLSVGGGSDYSTYFISANYGNEKGTRIGTSFEKFGLRINTDHKLSDFFKLGQTLYLWRTNKDPQADTDGTQIPFRTAPGMGVYDPTNPAPYSYKKWGYYNTSSPFQGYNPYANEEFDIQKMINETVEGSLYASVTPLKNLEWRTTGGLLARKESETKTGLQFYLGDQAHRNYPYFEDVRRSFYLFTLNSVINYNFKVGKHSISPMIGMETIQGQRDFSKASFDYYQLSTYPQTVNSGYEILDPNNLHVRKGESTKDPEARFYSLFGRLNYNFAEKYFFTFNVRRDASSRFSPENRVGVFPSFSVAWNIHEEPFMQSVPFISGLKIRAGSGQIGNSNIADFAYVSFYEQSSRYSWNNNLPSQGISRTNRFPNPEFKWESILTNNVALEVGLFDNRLDATIEYYVRDTKNMLYEKPIPSSVGFDPTVLTNIGKIRNSGLEITLNYRQTVNDLSFAVGVNGAFNTSKIVQLDGVDKDFTQGNFKFEVGEEIGQFYGLRSVGIYKDEESAKNGPTVNGNKPRVGDLIFVDRNSDGEIKISDDAEDDDRAYLGSAFPKLNYGITASAGYKNFDLSMLFSGAAGVQVSNEMRFYRQGFYGVEWNTTPAIFNNSGFSGNGVTDQPAHIHDNSDGTLAFDPYGNYSQFSSYRIEDAGYLKLRNVQLGYKLPAGLMERIGFSSARFYVMAQNLFVITNYSGIDPETSIDFGEDDNPDRRAIRAGEADKLDRYPPTRVFSIGLDLSF